MPRAPAKIKVTVGRVDNGATPIYVNKGTSISVAFTQAKMPLSSKDKVTNVKTNKEVQPDSTVTANADYCSAPQVDSA